MLPDEAMIIQEEFRPAIADGLRCCVDRFQGILKSFYISGSIASGEGLPGVSDTDCFLFFDEEPQEEDLSWCKAKGEALEKQYPVVKDYHLSLFSATRLRKEAAWRFILRYNAICLHGVDLISELEKEGIETTRPSKEMAKSRVNWMRKNIEGAVRGELPKELIPRLSNDPFLAIRKLSRNFILVEGAHLLMADNAFCGFRQDDVLAKLKTLYPQWASIFNRTETILEDPHIAGVTPDDYIAEIAPFCLWSIERIERA